MHSKFLKMFIILGVIVLAFSIGGTAFIAASDTPYLYKNVSVV